MRRDSWWIVALPAWLLVSPAAPLGCAASSEDGDAGAAGVDAAAIMEEECAVRAPTACPDPPPRYEDVEPIFRTRCVICHSGAESSPWPLTSYGHVVDWDTQIRGVVLNCTMPPPEENVPITVEERLAILTWLRCDAPR